MTRKQQAHGVSRALLPSCSISLEVKHDLAKVESRVRVSYIAPYATMAQSVEHIHGKDEVISSILIGSSIYIYAIGERDITYGYGP